MKTLSLLAMSFAQDIHSTQVRKYTGLPYVNHLAEVVGIAMTAGWRHPTVHPDVFMATGWLHDSLEDHPDKVSRDLLTHKFGPILSEGVGWLTEPKRPGVNRADRKHETIQRLSAAPGWVQTIKVADVISNLRDIERLDPQFALTYKAEKRALLAALNRADANLHAIALDLAQPVNVSIAAC